jgi:PAS domain S-box-containing protein
MWVYDLETLQFLAVNKAAIMHYGYSRQEFLAMTIKDIRPAEDVPALLDNIEHVARGFDRAGTWRHQKKDGSLIDVEITSHLIQFSDRPAEIVLANDVTERQQAEEALHKINETLKTFIRASPLAIVALDMERKVTLWNPAAERMFGWTEAEVMGQISPTIPEPDMTSQLTLRAEFLSSPLTISNMETRRLRKDGSTVEVSISVAALRDPANEIIGTIGIIADITERKQAEEELKDSHQRLEQTLAELRRKSEELTAMTEQLWQASKLATMGELAASIAHELNNPLATVALRTESLMMQLREDEPKRRALEIVAQEVDRMASLVNNLLQFSRRSHRQVSTVDVCDEIANSVDFVSFHLRSHRIEVVRDSVAALPTIQADRQQLRQLFLNLLTNASDAMPHGGTLTLTARSGTNESEEGAVVIEFADTGEGIAPADLEKIWDPFFTTKPEGRGTGLGLGICRRIIEEHGGTIAIESEIGKGTIVRIVFPATSNGVVARLL